MSGIKIIPAPHQLVYMLCALGVALHMYTVTFRTEGGGGWFLVALLLFSAVPYGIAALLANKPRLNIPALGAAAACFAADLYMHYSVFVAPKGSTAALGLLFMPAWNLIIVGPLGAAVFWMAFRLIAWQRRSH